MRKIILTLLDIFSFVSIILCFYLVARLRTFPDAPDTMRIGLFFVGMILPVVFGVVWGMYRIYGKRGNFPAPLRKFMRNSQSRFVFAIVFLAILTVLYQLTCYLIRVI